VHYKYNYLTNISPSKSKHNFLSSWKMIYVSSLLLVSYFMFRFICYFQSSLMLISTVQEVAINLIFFTSAGDDFNTSNKFLFAFISPSVLFFCALVNKSVDI